MITSWKKKYGCCVYYKFSYELDNKEEKDMNGFLSTHSRKREY